MPLYSNKQGFVDRKPQKVPSRILRFLKQKMENEDPWLALDKLYHILFCFSLTLVSSTLANLTGNPFLRRYSIHLGSIVSLLAGAAKEAADELGFFRSAGASGKDAVADVLGVLLAALGLSLLRHSSRLVRQMDQAQARGLSLV